jgi:uncharacterized damage-inducible protein DinB
MSMIEDETLLSAFLEEWSTYQSHLVTALAPLSAAQLAFGAAPQLRTIGVLAAHMIAARVWWFHYILGEGGPELAPMVQWDDDGAPPRSADELTGGLVATWKVMQEAMGHWTPADLAEVVRREVRGKQRAYARRWVIWHIIEHDLHHGGEISLTLGMHGLTAPDI